MDTDRHLSPLSCFYLDPNPRIAASWLEDHHVHSQAHALGRLWTQIARDLGVDLTDHPRPRGAYPDRPLTLAGSWAMMTAGNWFWFCAYTTWVYAEYRSRYPGRGDHASRGYVSWCWDSMVALNLTPPPGPLTIPPVRGVTAWLPDGQAPHRFASQREAARITRRVYAALPPFPTPAEEALEALADAVDAHHQDYGVRWRESVLKNPRLAYSLMPSHPVIAAMYRAIDTGASEADLAAFMLPPPPTRPPETPPC
jgi:hypothetical protein